MRPPEDLLLLIEEKVGGRIRSIVSVGGGCISNASRIETDDGPYFLKWAAGSAGETFAAEGEGLSALRSHAQRLVVPRPISMRNADANHVGHLLMDWIEEDRKNNRFWEQLGVGLAEIHRAATGRTFGLESDNYIGRLPQENGPCSRWDEFFATRRIQPQVEMARRQGGWETRWDAGLERLLARLPSLLPESPHPSLVHGDLWAGNVLAAKGNQAALVDPAVYWGHREVDLAMTQLFGGFPPAFYDAYDAEWQIEPAYEERRDVYNLYHLINHLNHFGGSYAGQVASILRRFAQ